MQFIKDKYTRRILNSIIVDFCFDGRFMQGKSYINTARESVPFNGKVEISTGGSQPDETIKTSGNVTKKSILIL